MNVTGLLERLDGLLDERVGAGRMARAAGISPRRAVHGKLAQARTRARTQGAARRAAGGTRLRTSATAPNRNQSTIGGVNKRPAVRAAGSRLRAAKRGGRRVVRR